MARPVRATTRVAGVIGSPVRHSLSPVLHNAAFAAVGLDWVFVAFEVPPGASAAAVDAMRALGIEGLSVTMPHKGEVVAAVDELAPEAARLGAVNCIARSGTRVIGHNTDGAGFVDALRLDEGFDPAGRRAVVIGAGGAARAVITALADAGAAAIGVVNRTEARAAAAAELAPGVACVAAPGAVADADLVVNATPAGMSGVVTLRPHAEVPELPADPRLLSRGQLVVDLVYEPAATPLLVAARNAGAAVANGLGMLIHQAAHAFRIWTGEDPPTEAMSAAAVAELARRGGAGESAAGESQAR